jgi:hypothetical protein
LRDQELADAGVPGAHAQLAEALLGALKSNEIVHALLADAIRQKQSLPGAGNPRS